MPTDFQKIAADAINDETLLSDEELNDLRESRISESTSRIFVNAMAHIEESLQDTTTPGQKEMFAPTDGRIKRGCEMMEELYYIGSLLYACLLKAAKGTRDDGDKVILPHVSLPAVGAIIGAAVGSMLPPADNPDDDPELRVQILQSHMYALQPMLDTIGYEVAEHTGINEAENPKLNSAHRRANRSLITADKDMMTRAHNRLTEFCLNEERILHEEEFAVKELQRQMREDITKPEQTESEKKDT